MMRFCILIIILISLFACKQEGEKAKVELVNPKTVEQQKPVDLTVIDTILNIEARLGEFKSGTIEKVVMNYLVYGIGLWSDNQLMQSCQIYSFDISRIKKNGEKKHLVNKGSKFGGRVSELCHRGEKGDIYKFENILIHCDDKQGLYKVNDLQFEIVE